MADKDTTYQTIAALQDKLEHLRYQLEEANETIEAIRTGQIDALVVQGENGHQLYTLVSADQTYRFFIEKMSEGAITLNPDGFILYSNTQFANMVQLPISNIIGSAFTNYIAPEFKERYHELFKKCWKTDHREEINLQSGSTTIPVQLSLTTLELEDGLALGIILTDLSKQKSTQQQLTQNNLQLADINQALESSNHDLQQFASVASHDLQEPLRKIQIFSNLLKEKQTQLTPDSKKYLEKIIDSSSRMKTLIIDILNYSRLSANNVDVDCVDLNLLISELQEDFELIIQEKNARLVMHQLPCVDVNRGQIRQVFQNIISNALKFAKKDEAPVITISAEIIREKAFDSPADKLGHNALITITDNGIGFDEQYVANIFSLFERLNTKDKYEGTGIGLAIAKKIIDKHNGLITATSKPGEGAQFKIILPLSQTIL